MGTLPIQRDDINVKILEFSHFYHILNPKNRTIAGLNVYKLFFISYNLVMLTITIIGCLGFLIEREYLINDTDFFLKLFSILHIYFSFWELTVILNNSILLWGVFDITKLTFLMSKPCCKNLRIMYEHRERAVRIANLFFIFNSVVFGLWLMYPLVLILFTSHDILNIRIPNILNLPFPVQIQTYNNYYIFFYIVELLISSNVTLTIVVVDTLFIIICWVTTAQYKVIGQSYRDIGYEDKPQAEDHEDFKSVIIDQQKIEIKLKCFFFAVRQILLVYVAFRFCSIVIITYTFIKRESTNFTIYSCNWTKMDLKFRKLLLLIMSVNNANKTVIRASPKKIIDLQFFASVIITSYNIVSVMLKTIKEEKK